MLFGSLSPIGVSLISSASPKIIQKTAPFRSQNFGTTDFSVGAAQNAANPGGFASISTKPQLKIRVPKSGSSINALAKAE
ncbi:MAG: hypothetical protein IJ043_08920 [Clostridia bacterium]|nr:hypothetical protein [Clostridia bacterium]